MLDWERMLSLDGNTAPYLQYAYARIRSIFRRAGVAVRPETAICLAEPAERALAFELVGFAAVVDEVAESLEFHHLTGYLYRLAATFSTFYERCPVLRAPTRRSGEPAVLCDSPPVLQPGCICSASEPPNGCDDMTGEGPGRPLRIGRMLPSTLSRRSVRQRRGRYTTPLRDAARPSGRPRADLAELHAGPKASHHQQGWSSKTAC